MGDIASRDQNRVTTIMGVASETITIGDIEYIEGETPVNIAVNPVTHAVLIESV